MAEARLAAGYAPPEQTRLRTPGQRAAEYVDALPPDKQEDVLLYLSTLFKRYGRQQTGHGNGERKRHPAVVAKATLDSTQHVIRADPRPRSRRRQNAASKKKRR